MQYDKEEELVKMSAEEPHATKGHATKSGATDGDDVDSKIQKQVRI